MAEHHPYRFAGMRSGDIVPWQRFLDRYENTFANHYYYNLRVSSNNEPIPGLPDDLQPIVRSLRKKRIDVVAWGSVEPLTWPRPQFPILDALNVGVKPQAGILTVIEVKKTASSSALGQLLSYPVLFRPSFDGLKYNPIRVMLVAEKLGADMEYLCKWLGVPYLLFPKPKP